MGPGRNGSGRCSRFKGTATVCFRAQDAACRAPAVLCSLNCPQPTSPLGLISFLVRRLQRENAERKYISSLKHHLDSNFEWATQFCALCWKRTALCNLSLSNCSTGPRRGRRACPALSFSQAFLPEASVHQERGCHAVCTCETGQAGGGRRGREEGWGTGLLSSGHLSVALVFSQLGHTC